MKLFILIALAEEEVIRILLCQRDRHQQLRWAVRELHERFEERVGTHFTPHPVELARNRRGIVVRREVGMGWEQQEHSL
jgi:hypothetical protein